jgi:hypothetical protein
MRTIAVLFGLLLTGGLLLPACHDDWAPLHDELGRTAEAFGLVAEQVGGSVGGWVDEHCGESCCELPSRQEFSRATREWARSVARDASDLGREMGRTAQDMGRDAGHVAHELGRDLGQGVQHSAEQLGQTAEQLAVEYGQLGDELERLFDSLESRANAVWGAVERFFADVGRALDER